MEKPIVYYKITAGKCSQFEITENYQPLSFFGDGFRVGTCASRGFTAADGTQTITEPFLGDITVKFFDMTKRYRKFYDKSAQASETSLNLYPTSRDKSLQSISSILVVALLCLFTSNGIAFTCFLFRHSALTSRERPLLVT